MSPTRRQFLQHIGGLCTVGSVAVTGLGLPLDAWGEDSGPIDCGPPPPAKPERRPERDAFPPLPLPLAPRRRLERKPPPTPPALVGKMAMGPVREVVRDGQRVASRDWMTDPADIRTLLAWTNAKLGINYRAIDTDAAQFSFDPRELPALLFAGHNEFHFKDAVRQSLARYVLEGGTILGDACCGWKDFADAFRREMEAIFPGRPLRRMVLDDPVLSAYYKLGAFSYKASDGTVREGEPCLEGIEFGCRTGVIFSPVDLTCGWDGHEHPRGTRVVIDQARQVGANLMTYILGSYPLGRFLSTQKVYFEASSPTRDDFVFAQLEHEGDWDPDPSAVHNLLKYAKDHSTLEVKFKRETLTLKAPQAVTYPLLYMTGHHAFRWEAEEVACLQRYLRAGGLLLADACCGRLAFDAAFRSQIAQVLPGAKLEKLPADHPLYHCHYEIGRVAYTPRVGEDFGARHAPELEGIALDGRLAVIYSRFDLGNGWEQYPHPYSYGLADESALQLGTNVIVYAITH
jgi:hypothetical protein